MKFTRQAAVFENLSVWFDYNVCIDWDSINISMVQNTKQFLKCTCSTIMPNEWRHETISCRMGDAASNPELDEYDEESNGTNCSAPSLHNISL